MTELELGRDAITIAAQQIGRYVRRTPVVVVDGADFGLAAFPLTVKLEQLQHAGSFKTRGAFVSLLQRSVPAAGVVAASGGNHGAAVAYAAKTLGVRATIFVPSISSPAKIARIREYGARLEIGGDRYADALAASEAWTADSGALRVHAFDQDETILGQGTLARELEDQAPDIDTVLVPVGGGGLIGGVAAWYRGATRVVGVEPELAPQLARALEAGRPVDAQTEGIAADSLGSGRIGARTFPLAQRFVERVVLVSDDAIRAAQAALWQQLRVVAEPGGAAAFAALLSGSYRPDDGERVAVIVSGGNTTAVDFER